MKTTGRFLATLAALVLLSAQVARADDSDDRDGIEMAKAHYAIALKAFEDGDYLLAVTQLKRSYFLSHRSTILLNLGRTYTKMGDRSNAVRAYRQYLAEAPADATNRAEVNRTIEDLLSPTPHPSYDENVDRQREQYEGPDSWTHQAIDAAPPGVPLDVVVRGPINPKSRKMIVRVHYRATGRSDFTAVKAERFLEERVARVPADALLGNTLQYYVVAESPGGGTMYLSASAVAPNVVVVEPGATKQRSIAMEVWLRTREEQAIEAKRGVDREPRKISWRESLEREERRRRQRAHAGIGLLAGGALLSAASAAIGFGLASAYSSAVSNDSRMRPRLVFDDPAASESDRNYARAGQIADTFAIVGTCVGVAAVIAGAVLMITARKPRTFSLAPELGPSRAGLSVELRY